MTFERNKSYVWAPNTPKIENALKRSAPVHPYVVSNSTDCSIVYWYLTPYDISVISWRSVWLVAVTGVPTENHRSTASHWQTYQIMLYRLHFAMSGFATCRWPTIDIRCTYNVFVSMILMKIQDMGVFFSIHVWPTKYLSHRWPRMCSVCCNNNPVLSSFITYVGFVTRVTLQIPLYETGTTYPSGAPPFILGF
jgi:hypothetical protein